MTAPGAPDDSAWLDLALIAAVGVGVALALAAAAARLAYTIDLPGF